MLGLSFGEPFKDDPLGDLNIINAIGIVAFNRA